MASLCRLACNMAVDPPGPTLGDRRRKRQHSRKHLVKGHARRVEIATRYQSSDPFGSPFEAECQQGYRQ
jgi:hypothetical protein